MRTNATTPSREGSVAEVHDDGDTVRRSVTIRRPIEEVRQGWSSSGMAGDVEFADAPGELGTEVHATAPRDEQSTLKEIINAWKSDDPGESLHTRLREFKARLETGEVATTNGQPSGRESKNS